MKILKQHDQAIKQTASVNNGYKSPFGLKKEMGISRREFFNLLPKALAGYAYSVQDNGAVIELSRGIVKILVGEEEERRLSEYVRIPLLPVEIQFVDATSIEREDFQRKFDFSYMKGLG